jgi:hypothetical protein
MIDIAIITARFDALARFLNERDRRLFAASEARAAGRGGVAAVSRATGLARSTIGRGLADLQSGAVPSSTRVRRRGGGSKAATQTQPGLLDALRDLVESSVGEPVISVDTKKKELVGDFKNGGRELRPKGQPEPVRVHDFPIPELGKAVPYGIYDITNNAGWVNLGISHDTAAFAVESIRRWWHELGATRYPTATRLLINADCGGSNGARVHLWKRELQVLADELGIAITVCHLPPGTSKWNRIEHRLFAFITMNWRGKPLVSYQVIVQLIANTTTDTGLTVACRLDANAYEKGIKVSKAEMATLNIQPASFHGEWNYTVTPRRPDG